MTTVPWFDKPLFTYDLETYIDTFLFVIKEMLQPNIQIYEISPERNDRNQLLQYLMYLKNIDAHMLGYNDIDFDYPITHELIVNPYSFDAYKAYSLSQKIIDHQKRGFRPYSIPLKDRHIHQIDLMKIWHFDNKNKRTRLKDLQVAMRSENVMDLPYDFHKPITPEQRQHVRVYGTHDVTETEKFALFTADRIKLRRDLIKEGKLFGDVLNWNDTKLGEQFFINKLGRKHCYDGSRPKGTDRLRVDLKEVILDKVQFRLPQFQEVRETFETKTWWKGDKDANETIPFTRTLAGLDFKFGSGGVHASVNNRIYHSSGTHKILDIDVSGMYPAVGIANKFFPEHLGEKFVEVYKQLKADRKQYPKGSAMNAVLKLAQNGVYGKSNSEYSPMFDIKYLFKITINGQLQLTQLAEMLSSIPGLELIQCNTDGITAYVPREHEYLFDVWKKAWEEQTGLELEQVEYKSMFIRDVNSYIAVKTDGKVKRKGAYWYPESWKDYDEAAGHWHTDLSMLVVPKVAEQVMLYGYNPEFVLRTMTDPFDFMIRQKIQGEQKGFIGRDETQRTVRYYVSTQGAPFVVVHPAAGPEGQYKRKNKIADKFYNQVMSEIGMGVWDERIHTGKAGAPATQKKYEKRVNSICAGFKVRDCCEASKFNWNDVDYGFYLEEINKLIIRNKS